MSDFDFPYHHFEDPDIFREALSHTKLRRGLLQT